MHIKRILLTTVCCALSGLLFHYLIKWDWSFFIIPIMMAFSISLTNYDILSTQKKWLGILLHVLLSIILLFATIFVTFSLSTKIDSIIIFNIGCAIGAILFALITQIILPFQRFWLGMLIVLALSLVSFPLATFIYGERWNLPSILYSRINIAIAWTTLVGLGVSIGIHYRKI